MSHRRLRFDDDDVHDSPSRRRPYEGKTRGDAHPSSFGRLVRARTRNGGRRSPGDSTSQHTASRASNPGAADEVDHKLQRAREKLNKSREPDAAEYDRRIRELQRSKQRFVEELRDMVQQDLDQDAESIETGTIEETDYFDAIDHLSPQHGVRRSEQGFIPGHRPTVPGRRPAQKISVATDRAPSRSPRLGSSRGNKNRNGEDANDYVRRRSPRSSRQRGSSRRRHRDDRSDSDFDSEYNSDDQQWAARRSASPLRHNSSRKSPRRRRSKGRRTPSTRSPARTSRRRTAKSPRNTHDAVAPPSTGVAVYERLREALGRVNELEQENVQLREQLHVLEEKRRVRCSGW